MRGSDFMTRTAWWRDVLDHDKAAILQIIEGAAASAEVKRNDTLIVAVAGQSALGKSAFSHQLARYIGRPNNVIDLDAFLIPRTERDKKVPPISGLARAALRLDLAVPALLELINKRRRAFNYYSHETGDIRKTGDPRLDQHLIELLDGPDYFLIEGVPALHEELRELADLRIFVTATEGTQLELLTRTQITERGFDPDYSYDVARRKIREFRQYGEGFRATAHVVLACDRNYRYSVDSVRDA